MTIATVLILAAPLRVLTLAEALRTAEAHQPQLRLARANTEAAEARVGAARAAVLPQLAGTASYQRTTSNFVRRPGVLPASVTMMPSQPATFQTFNFYNFGVTLSQFVWDFRAPFAWRATRATAEALAATERSTRVQVLLDVRVAFFNARSQKALAAVARHNLTNQARHREQTRGFVDVGRQPAIALATAETNYANAEVQSINADNAYELARVQLQQAMGLDGWPDYEVAEDTQPPVEGEDRSIGELYAEALRARPDLASLEQQIRAQWYTVAVAWGGFGPALAASTSLTDVGSDITDLTWNWNATVTATWTLFDSLLARSLAREASATERGLMAQRDALRQQVLVDVSQAQLNVRAAKATWSAADKAVVNARLQLGLAEGRYQQNVGNVIELSDAQFAHTQAGATRVQAEYNLATARAQLLRALGRLY